MAKLQSRSILKGAFILSLAGLISKIISAGYRIPLQNLTGDLGFYIYQQVYPILGIALILSLYGFPAAISKLISEFDEERSPLSIPSFFLPVVGWLTVAAILIFVLGYTQSPRIASLMGDEKLIPSLRVAFVSFLVVPIVSVLRGVFQGNHEMAPTAVSQIVEQVIRVGTIIFSAVFVMQGADIYSVGVGASIGSIAGAVAALALLFYWVSKNKEMWTRKKWQKPISYKKTIFLHGIIICLNYMLLLSLQLVDAFTLVPNLLKTGMDLDAARLAKGVFDRGQPLIQLGTVLASSLALALIPSVNQRRMVENREKVEKSILSSVKVTAVISLGAAAGLIFLFPSINHVFFQDTQGTGSLRILMVVIIGSSVSITTASILQGLGYMKHTAMIVAGAIVIKAAANTLMVPVWEVNGAAIASVIAVTFVLIGNVVILRHEVPLKKWTSLPWGLIVSSLLGMVSGLAVMEWVIQLIFEWDGRIQLLFYTLTLTGAGAAIYLALLLKTGSFTKEETKSLPSYKWLKKFLPKGMN